MGRGEHSYSSGIIQPLQIIYLRICYECYIIVTTKRELFHILKPLHWGFFRICAP
ncbi:hypothetical protein VPHD51_0102 [Vibrio phage D51]